MPVLNVAPAWIPDRFEIVTLWHGCTDSDRLGIERHRGIDLSRSRPDLDFGRGFYMTTLRRQAEHWAVRRFDLGIIRRAGNSPVVLRFRMNRVDLAKLMTLHFVLAGYDDEDFWSLVQHCRRSSRPRRGVLPLINDHQGPVEENGYRWFDLVSGPVVADWKQRSAMQQMDQFSFHTARAIKLLNSAILSKDPERYLWLPINP